MLVASLRVLSTGKYHLRDAIYAAMRLYNNVAICAKDRSHVFMMVLLDHNRVVAGALSVGMVNLVEILC